MQIIVSKSVEDFEFFCETQRNLSVGRNAFENYNVEMFSSFTIESGTLMNESGLGLSVSDLVQPELPWNPPTLLIEAHH
jgi:hypothetical protein